LEEVEKSKADAATGARTGPVSVVEAVPVLDVCGGGNCTAGLGRKMDHDLAPQWQRIGHFEEQAPLGDIPHDSG